MNMFNPEIQIENRKISKNQKPFLVAEIGLNHNNDIEIGKRTIQAAKKSGVDAVKFQSYITEDFIDIQNAESKFLFDIFKNYELDESKHRIFQQTAKDEGLIFFSTPLDVRSVQFLTSIQVPLFKIASGDIVNSELLEAVSKTGKPIFLSSGAADFFEIARAVNFLHSEKVKELCLFYCVSLYPTPIEELNLKTISLFEESFQVPIGFSDHSEGFLASAIAVSYNACVIEKHFTLDKTLDGPDHTISLNPEEMKLVTDSIYKAYLMRGESRRNPSQKEVEGRFYGRRSIYKSENKPMAKRPAIHLRDNKYYDSWEYLKLKSKDIQGIKEGSPIKCFF
jgi:sialic acid synthase SpsE